MTVAYNDWITPTERREKIIKYIDRKRHVTMDDIAYEFGVSNRTIRSDIKYLSHSYPISTIRGKYGGGVMIQENFYLSNKYLNTKQIDLLEKLKHYLPSRDVVIIDSILNEFALCR